MERRCQEVIDRCWQMGDANPILFIHDVGAGGLSNARSPELVSDGGRGGKFQLRDILSDEPGMSPLEIWCNESRERYVLAVTADQLPLFDELCAGAVCRSERGSLRRTASHTERQPLRYPAPIDMPLDVLLGKPPKMTRDVQTLKAKGDALNRGEISIADAVNRVLHLPTVAEKTFLVTIGDRTVTGMVARDQMVIRGSIPGSQLRGHHRKPG